MKIALPRVCRAVCLICATVAALPGCQPSIPSARESPEVRRAAAKLGPSGPLAPLYAALADTRHGPVAIVQIGDSHTANGSFTGHLRELFQARFGDGGAGMLPPGVPYTWYRPGILSVRDEGFRRVTSYSGAPGPFGVAGLRQHTDGPAQMTLDAEQPGQFRHAEIEVLTQSGGGTLDISADGADPVGASTVGFGETKWIAVPASPGGQTLTVRARGDGPVDVLGWRFGGAPGVQYSGLGTIGAQAGLIASWDRAIVADELARIHPAAVVVAFGTNEGFDDSLDLAAYAQTYAAQLRMLRDAAPDAALIVLGPPDGERRVRIGGVGTGCDGGTVPGPVIHHVVKRRATKRRPAEIVDVVTGGGWAVPPHLDAVRDILRRAAAEQGAYYWDWRAAMGGACSMRRWAAQDLAHTDHVHLKGDGYRRTADALFAELMAGYDRYLAIAGAR